MTFVITPATLAVPVNDPDDPRRFTASGGSGYPAVPLGPPEWGTVEPPLDGSVLGELHAPAALAITTATVAKRLYGGIHSGAGYGGSISCVVPLVASGLDQLTMTLGSAWVVAHWSAEPGGARVHIGTPGLTTVHPTSFPVALKIELTT